MKRSDQSSPMPKRVQILNPSSSSSSVSKSSGLKSLQLTERTVSPDESISVAPSRVSSNHSKHSHSGSHHSGHSSGGSHHSSHSCSGSHHCGHSHSGGSTHSRAASSHSSVAPSAHSKVTSKSKGSVSESTSSRAPTSVSRCGSTCSHGTHTSQGSSNSKSVVLHTSNNSAQPSQSAAKPKPTVTEVHHHHYDHSYPYTGYCWYCFRVTIAPPSRYGRRVCWRCAPY